jgi:hypothetical protein
MFAKRPERGTAGAHFRRSIPPAAVASEAACRELVHRIVHSQRFGRSERLGALLTFVCEVALDGREAELNERKIGREVFGRSQDYDPAVDGIVRSQASRLRQRLEMYFEQEGSNEPVRIVIPRGGYVPVFEAQGESSPIPSIAEPINAIETVASATPQITNIQPQNSSLWRWGLSLVLGLMLIVLWVHDHWSQVPVVAAPQTHPFWSHVFQSRQPTLVVAPDSGLVLFHGLSGKDIDLNEYLLGGYRSELSGPPRIGPKAARRDWLLDLANRRYTSMVDLEAILSLKDRARALGSGVSVRYARDLRPNDFKSGTVILLGAASANPWVELFEQNMNFILKDDYTKSFWVLNRSPKKGEPTRWEITRDDRERRVFGVVAYVPNLGGDGNALILEGTSMSGTEAATDFVDDDAQLMPFLNRIRHPDGTLPHFELLLETHNMGASAARIQILAWRTVN